MSPILQTFLLLLYVVLVLQDDVHAFARTPSLTLHRHFVRTSSGAYPEFSVRRDLTTDDSPTSFSFLAEGTCQIISVHRVSIRHIHEFLFVWRLFFYWQAGVVTYLREQSYNLDGVRVGGASAGALTATLTAANVDFYEATDLALRLATEAGVWDRSNGLQGIWGPLIETWLHTLLPDDVVETVNGKVRLFHRCAVRSDSLLLTPHPASTVPLCLLLTEIPGFKKKRVDDFRSKHDLIDCNMASVHLVSTLYHNAVMESCTH